MGLGRTDLAVELKEDVEEQLLGQGVSVSTKQYDNTGIMETVIRVENEMGSKTLGKAIGTYITIESNEMECMDTSYHVPMMEILQQHLRESLKGYRHVLFVGLGNRMVTPDALGPLVVDNLCITRHLIMEKLLDANYMYSSLAPGVMAQTGMETSSLLKGVVEAEKPDVIVAIDALAARNVNRLNKTIQLSDTGISPGSGVGNHRAAINQESLGVPVIAIGVPTVISVPAIVDEAMDSILNQLGKTGMKEALSSFSDKERYDLAKEMLTPELAEMFVTPKNVDDAVKRISYTISEAFNQLLGLDDEILAYIH